jgi:hypothetical protein
MKILVNFMIRCSFLLIEAINAILKNASGIVFTLKQGVLTWFLTVGNNRPALISIASIKDSC